MNDKFDETTYYRHFRTLDGRLEPIDVVRRNGRLVPRFSPSCTEHNPTPLTQSTDLRELLREVMYGLNRKQRRTWLLLLLQYPILEVARQERVTPTAIYERLRGSSKGHGGMIRKNEYVAIWWRRQRKHDDHD